MIARRSGVMLMADAAGEPVVRLRRGGQVVRIAVPAAELVHVVLAEVPAHRAAVLLSLYGPEHDAHAAQLLREELGLVLSSVRLTPAGYEAAQ